MQILLFFTTAYIPPKPTSLEDNKINQYKKSIVPNIPNVGSSVDGIGPLENIVPLKGVCPLETVVSLDGVCSLDELEEVRLEGGQLVLRVV